MVFEGKWTERTDMLLERIVRRRSGPKRRRRTHMDSFVQQPIPTLVRYFLTGATGFLGSRLTRQLVDEGHDVVALVRESSDTAALPGAVERAVGDITEKSSMREPMRGADGVFHLAAWYSVGNPDPERAERINVDGTRNVLELVGELGIPKAVYTSTLAINSDTGGRLVDESYRHEGEHLSVYDRTKWQAHHQVAKPMAEAGLPVVILLPGLIYGPGDRGPMWTLWKAYLERSLPAIPRKTAYCWGHVVDTAAIHRSAMAKAEAGRSYIVAGAPHSIVDAFDIAEEVTGIDAPPAVPPVLFRWGAGLMSIPARVLSLPPMYQPEAMRVFAGATYLGDNGRAERELGLEHRPLEEGLRETLEYELDHLSR